IPRALPDLATAERERSLILLIDDHPTNRLVIARQLALAGYACEAVDGGEEGLQRWRSGRYALVLSDVHMPGLDGYGLARAIRAEEAHSSEAARTPIVALTASALKGEAEACLAAGMDDCLVKPVAVARLAATLRRWLPHTAA
ncbi:response regulator, partial [Lysobacter sp. 2RAB21]